MLMLMVHRYRLCSRFCRSFAGQTRYRGARSADLVVPTGESGGEGGGGASRTGRKETVYDGIDGVQEWWWAGRPLRRGRRRVGILGWRSAIRAMLSARYCSMHTIMARVEGFA